MRHEMRQVEIFREKPEHLGDFIDTVGIYLFHEGHLLYLKYASCKPDDLKGRWGVPAGKIHKDEVPEAGARRELYEETGIALDTLEEVGSLFFRKPGCQFRFILFYSTINTTPAIDLSVEHCEYQWVTPHEALRLALVDGADDALEFVLDKLDMALPLSG